MTDLELQTVGAPRGARAPGSVRAARDVRASGQDEDGGYSSRLIPASELSQVLSGHKAMADILEQVDVQRNVDRPEIVRIRCNIADGATFDVRDLLGRVKQQQPKNYDWHILKLIECPTDPQFPGERTIHSSTLRDFSDLSECSAITFGRNTVNDWVVPNALISRRHGIVLLDEQRKVWVFDGRQVDPSTNGLYYMDRQPQITKRQEITSSEEFVGFGPPVRHHDGHRGFLFHIRIEWLKR